MLDKNSELVNKRKARPKFDFDIWQCQHNVIDEKNVYLSKRLRNSSGKGGNLFLPSSSFILSDISLLLIAE
ncbi:hypothetical protein Golax_005236, partial [Gossypium laxum]|nr:hypothetical protein [Gossypium laxum]